MLAAPEPSSPLLHDSWGDNLYLAREFEAGDIEQAREAATVVIEREYRLNRHAGVPMEGRAALAFWDERLDELVFYNSTQMPHQVRYARMRHLGGEIGSAHV